MSELANKQCVPCRGGVPPLSEKAQMELLLELKDWQIIESHHLSKKYSFASFAEGLAFVNTVAQIAEDVDHHPEIYFSFRDVTLDIWTHKIDNLTENDFVLAAKIDARMEQI